MSEIKEPLRNFIASELLSGERTVADDESLLADGMIDSMGVVRLVAFAEDTFGCQIPPEDVTIDNFRSIDNLAAYLGTRIHAN